MDVWDVRLRQGHTARFAVPAGRPVMLAVLRGSVLVNGSQVAHDAQVAMLDRSGDELLLEGSSDTTLLLLSGAPIDEPVVGYGPFVMNSVDEINQAIEDFNSGRFGKIAPASAPL